MGPAGMALSKDLEHRKIWVRILTYAPSYFRYLQERSIAPLKKLFYQRESILSKRILKKNKPTGFLDCDNWRRQKKSGRPFFKWEYSNFSSICIKQQ